jgi:hypothetical protein
MKLARDLILYFVGIALVGMLHDQEILLLVAFIVGVSVYFKKYWNQFDFILFMMGFIFGPLADMVAIPLGAWEYTNHLYFIFPLWYPIAFGIMLVLLKRIAFQVSERVK